MTPFVTLSINLGALTLVSFVLVSEVYLTYTPCFPSYAISRFWVGTNSVTNRSCKFNPYFTPLTSSTRLYGGIFQREPAIAELDRLFTPIHRSFKHMHIALVQASIPLSRDFTLPMNRSPGFRSYLSDSRLFRLAFASVTRRRRLASPQRETPWPVLQNVRYKSMTISRRNP